MRHCPVTSFIFTLCSFADGRAPGCLCPSPAEPDLLRCVCKPPFGLRQLWISFCDCPFPPLVVISVLYLTVLSIHRKVEYSQKVLAWSQRGLEFADWLVYLWLVEII